MGGGLMQLVAYGAQDIYLTGNPQITFFKVVYRRHTNFSMEEISQTPNGSIGFDQTASFTISRNGDLIHKMYFEFSPKDMFAPVTLNGGSGKVAIASYIGNTILKETEIEIGGQLIDRHYSHWLSTWNDLTEYNPTGEIAQISTKNSSNTPRLSEPGGMSSVTNDHDLHNGAIMSHIRGGAAGEVSVGNANDNESLMSTVGGKPTLFQKMSFNHLGIFNNQATSVSTASSAGALFGGTGIGSSNFLPKKAYIPLRFWFNRNPGLALPLIALQYHEVKVNIQFCSSSDIIFSTASTEITAQPRLTGKLWTQYIYLDTDERRRFAQVSHEYLIEQLQFQSEGNSGNYTLNFNHPVKEIIWGGKPATSFETVNDESAPSGANFGRILGNGFLSSFKLNSAAVSTTTALSNGDLNVKAGASTAVAAYLSTNNISEDIKWILKLNGHDRFSERHTTYFSRKQVSDYHTGLGGVANRDCILVYSFALKPEEHQPSGTCNFSRIDTAQLNATGFPTSTNKGVYIYAVNYNVLRIMSGMGGLAYSN